MSSSRIKHSSELGLPQKPYTAVVSSSNLSFSSWLITSVSAILLTLFSAAFLKLNNRFTWQEFMAILDTIRLSYGTKWFGWLDSLPVLLNTFLLITFLPSSVIRLLLLLFAGQFKWLISMLPKILSAGILVVANLTITGWLTRTKVISEKNV